MTDENIMGILLEIKDKMKSDLNEWETESDIEEKFDFLMSCYLQDSSDMLDSNI